MQFRKEINLAPKAPSYLLEEKRDTGNEVEKKKKDCKFLDNFGKESLKRGPVNYEVLREKEGEK